MAEEKKSEAPYMGDKLVGTADFNVADGGSRGCTDILCLLLIIAHWGAMTAIGAMGLSEGDYRVVVYPFDISGNICGIDYKGVDMTDFPYLYPINSFGMGVCVKACPVVSDPFFDVFASIGTDGFNSAYDESNIGTANFTFTSADISPVYAADPENAKCTGAGCYTWTDTYINEGSGSGFSIVDTSSFLSRCYLSTEGMDALSAAVTTDPTTPKADEDEGYFTLLYADLFLSRGWILGFGFVIAMVVSFSYTFLLRVPGFMFTMVWGCIFITLAMLVGVGYSAYTESIEWADEDPQEHTDNEIQGLQGVSIGFMVVAGVWFCIICFLRSRIQLALAIVGEAAKAVAAMPVIIFFPIIQCAGFVGFMLIWMAYAVNLASLGDLVESGFCTKASGSASELVCTSDLIGGLWYTYRTFEFDETQTNMGYYLLFCYFWTSQFIIAVGQIAIAMAVSKWYFTRDKATVGSHTVYDSVKTTMYYHTGTAAFGSLIIAIIKMIRAAVAYVQKKAKDSGNKLAQAILCAIQCFMWCMEKCMKFLNKNAYIQTAIFGTNFCVSAKNAFFLILRNIARIGACSIVSEFIIIIGKFFICIVTAGLAYFALDANMGDDLSSPVGPVFFIGVMSWFTASMFMNIFAMAISTILQCFVADEEMFDAETRFADHHLATFIDENGAHKDPKEKAIVPP